jgi:hypothetical protein
LVSLRQQTGPGKQRFKLIHPIRQEIPAWVHQQDQVVAAFQPAFQEPVRFPANSPRPVPFHRVPEFPGKRKGYPIEGKPVFPPEQLGPQATGRPPVIENRPYFPPFL